MNNELIMGVPVDHITYKMILRDVKNCLESEYEKLTITSVNPQILVGTKKFPEVIEFIEKSTHRIPDGVGIVLASKLTGGQIKNRVTGFDLMLELLKLGNANGKKAFFYGAKPDVLNKMLKNIAIEYPKLIISGGVDGYTSLSDDELIEMINRAKPDFLFVAMGFPKQEIWLNQNYERLYVKVFQDVGGSFDVLSGEVKRAPQFFMDYHLEWLYRSLRDPKRIYRIFQLPVFIIKSLYWKLINQEGG